MKDNISLFKMYFQHTSCKGQTVSFYYYKVKDDNQKL